MSHLAFTFWLSVQSTGLWKRQTNVRTNISKMRWQRWIWVSCLSLSHRPINCCNQSVFFWAERRHGSGYRDEMEMDTRMCLKMAGELRKVHQGVSPRVILCCSHQLVPVPATLMTVQGKQDWCGGGRWTGRSFSHFSSSLFFTDSSGKIISGPHTAWTTEVSAVTRPQSGLVHWWQFLGTTGDPTETCIGSSCFVLLPSLVSRGLQVLLKLLSRVLMCCDAEYLVYYSGGI